MSAVLKTFLEHPVFTVLALVLYFALCIVAMKIGFTVMILVLKALSWLVPQLDVAVEMLRDIR